VAWERRGNSSIPCSITLHLTCAFFARAVRPESDCFVFAGYQTADVVSAALTPSTLTHPHHSHHFQPFQLQ